MPILFIGIDVSKARLDVFVRPTGETFSLSNARPDIQKLVQQLLALAPALIVLEATGGYEALAARALQEAGLSVAVVNPNAVRQFARATGKLAKTDPLDARVLAHFAEAIRPVPRPLPDAQTEELSQLVARRRQLVEMLVAERNRLRQTSGLAHQDVTATITFLEGRLARLDEQLAQQVKQKPDWQQKANLLASVPGVGPGLTHTLLAELPELGTLTAKQVAALAGVAPFNCDSGPRRGSRHIYGGRAALRAMLYMATMASLRCNPTIRSYYDQLVARGKPGLVAMVACMRKLLVIVNAMVKAHTPWRRASPAEA